MARNGAAAAFLCSQYSGFIVGQNLLLDGGAFNCHVPQFRFGDDYGAAYVHLLKELNHRVMNSFAAISAITAMETRAADAEAAALLVRHPGDVAHRRVLLIISDHEVRVVRVAREPPEGQLLLGAVVGAAAVELQPLACPDPRIHRFTGPDQ